jgi:hypothetical protein
VRLAELLDEWVAAGRPSASELRMTVYPAGAPLPPDAETVVRKAHSQLVLHWPTHP